MKLLAMTLFATIVLAAGASARADDAATYVNTAAKKFYALHTFHATETAGSAVTQLDFQLPNRVHETLPNGAGSATIIGSDMWMTMNGGKTMHIPGMGAMATQMVTMLRSMGLKGEVATMYSIAPVSAQGPSNSRAFRLTAKHGGQSETMWIDKTTMYPVRVDVPVQGKVVTIVYSAYNQPLQIVQP